MTDLWPWALAAYPRPGVEAACLTLQDEHRVNVCYLLWAAWGEAENLPLDLAAGAALAEAWEAKVAAPLRAARRDLKTDWACIAPDRRTALREKLKQLELSAERLLLESLAALPPGAASVTLAEAAALWRAPPPPQSISNLNAAITNPIYAGDAGGPQADAPGVHS